MHGTRQNRFLAAGALRVLSAEMVETAKSGHPGLPLGFADAMTVLYEQFLHFDPQDPTHPARDRVILSAGHGSALLYATNTLCGYVGYTPSDLARFRQLGSPLPGHPEFAPERGIETTSGPLGQGFANAVGVALSQAMHPDIHFKTYCILGDGCLMEGLSQEVLSFAAHQKLGNLIVLFDDNAISIDGATDLATSENQCARFAAAGWDTQEVDGHDTDAVAQALRVASDNSTRPQFIACRTTIGHGAPLTAGTEKAHGAPLGAEQLRALKERYAWPQEACTIPAEITEIWHRIAHAGRTRLHRRTAPPTREPSPKRHDADWEALTRSFTSQIETWQAQGGAVATRKASQKLIEIIQEYMPQVVGGSADLSTSTGTITRNSKAITAESRDGNFVHYGVREHAMAAIMNGLALDGRVLPYGGTFLVFSDYLRPALRLSAVMERQVIFVLSHDSIGVGEDGPTHQPIEHLASLRAIPNLRVYRPADACETAWCWLDALRHNRGPSALILSRQDLPILKTAELTASDAAVCDPLPCARGAYNVKTVEAEAPSGAEAVTLVATGSEVTCALGAAAKLAEFYRVRVISMPCVERFLEQPRDRRCHILGPKSHVFTLEAGATLGWARIATRPEYCLGLDNYGASAPGPELFRHFGITPEAVAANVREQLTTRGTRE